MCIVDPTLYDSSGSVSLVANTSILVAPQSGTNYKRQLTVYSNRVRMGGDTQSVAMILPVPNPGHDPRDITVVDTSDDSNGTSQLFSALRPLTRKLTLSYSNSYLMANGSMEKGVEARSVLPVHTSGSYEFTIVPRMDYFGRLDRRLLPRPPSPPVMKLLNEHYGKAFSFIVCKLSAASDAQYHPLAYTHPVMVRTANHVNVPTLFVPTLHYHGDEEQRHTKDVAASDQWSTLDSSFGQYMPVNALFDSRHSRHSTNKNNPHWDHEIYAFGVKDAAEFGLRQKDVVITQAGLNQAMKSVPNSYKTVLGEEPDTAAFRFRRMFGDGFENGDIFLDAVVESNNVTTNNVPVHRSPVVTPPLPSRPHSDPSSEKSRQPRSDAKKEGWMDKFFKSLLH